MRGCVRGRVHERLCAREADSASHGLSDPVPSNLIGLETSHEKD